jgi:hypothetical protein
MRYVYQTNHIGAAYAIYRRLDNMAAYTQQQEKITTFARQGGFQKLPCLCG